MTSFAAAIEPAASPRLAAAALLVHLAAAAPWLARVDAPLALLLTLAAIAGFALSLRRLPGRHCPLAAIDLDADGGCRVRLSRSPLAARGTGTRFTCLRRRSRSWISGPAAAATDGSCHARPFPKTNFAA